MAANRLADEPSPYLEQHKDNPVDWWPWGDAAFAEAKRRDVPVFLSIGYATCHWCHVMAHESFEDEATAGLLNEAFVCVKVDREERPDVDAVYMDVCQAMTGSGGWPLTVLLTPRRQPFFAATYIPKRSHGQRVGLTDLVPRVQEAWRDRREDVERASDDIVARLRRPAPEAGPAPDPQVLERAHEALAGRFDAKNGGFGEAPKFPSPHQLRFLLRMHLRGRRDALPMAQATLEAIARGGIRDHVGGGFHRYSTDAGWLAPHFEKMLYDQAGLLLAYAEAYAVAGQDTFREAVEDTVGYLERDLRHPQGGFFSAEDADSEGEEGRFYTWPHEELLSLVAPWVANAYGAQPEGNHVDEATRRPTGRNILHLPRPLEDVAGSHGMAAGEVRARLREARARLLSARGARVRPLRDEKVLTDWNGLAIAALARASVLCNEPRYAKRAGEAARFVLGHLQGDGLSHMWRDGRTDGRSFLDDHAFLLWGLVELHQADQDSAWLREAVALAGLLVGRFQAEDGGLWMAPAEADEMPLRPRDAYDGAVPSGASVAVEALWRLGRVTGDSRHEEAAWRVLRAHGAELRRHPHAFTAMLCGLDAALGPAREVVVAGPRGDPATRRLLAAAQEGLRPATVVLLCDPGDEALVRVCPWTEAYGPVDGAPAAYVCADHVCQRPVSDPADVRRLLA